MKKNYHISTYGSWYTRIENIDEQTQKGIEIYSKDYFKDIIKYGYVDFQGKYDNYQIGHIEKDIYSLCRVKIIKGRKIQNDQEILINQKYKKVTDRLPVSNFLLIIHEILHIILDDLDLVL